MLHGFNLVRKKGLDALCTTFQGLSVHHLQKLPGYFPYRTYATRPRQHEHHLDDDGFILKSIIETRQSFLLSHNLLNDGIIFMNHLVYANRHLYAAEQVDRYGMTNLERMKKGLRPIALTGEDLIVIHHLEQTHRGTWVVLPNQFHCQYDALLHSQVRTKDPVRRLEFKSESQTYWQEEAKFIESLCARVKKLKL